MSKLDAMIGLARLSTSCRVIVAGSQAFGLYLGLLDRGFARAANTATCRVPCGQHGAALIAGDYSANGLDRLLERMVPFLNARATVVIWMNAVAEQEAGKPRTTLERFGFRIEAGTRCDGGFVVCAQRGNFSPLAKAA
jgi:hypothetical protein